MQIGFFLPIDMNMIVMKMDMDKKDSRVEIPNTFIGANVLIEFYTFSDSPRTHFNNFVFIPRH